MLLCGISSRKKTPFSEGMEQDLKTLKNTAKLTVLAAVMAIGSQASAHEVVNNTVTLQSIAAGATEEFVITCPHHYQYVVSGGVKINKQLTSNGPLMVTSSYPKTTRSWAIEFTNRAGRPTGAQEVNVTFSALCNYRH